MQNAKSFNKARTLSNPCLVSFTLLTKSHTLGFGYPHSVDANSTFLGSLFQLPTLMGLTLQSLYPAGQSKKSFLSPSPFMHFLTKPIGLASALQWLHPTPSAVPLLATLTINQGAGAHALLGFSASVGSPSANPFPASFPTENPFTFFIKNDFSTESHVNLKVCSIGGLAVSPRRGCRPIWPFPPTAVSNPFET